MWHRLAGRPEGLLTEAQLFHAEQRRLPVWSVSLGMLGAANIASVVFAFACS